MTRNKKISDPRCDGGGFPPTPQLNCMSACNSPQKESYTLIPSSDANPCLFSRYVCTGPSRKRNEETVHVHTPYMQRRVSRAVHVVAGRMTRTFPSPQVLSRLVHRYFHLTSYCPLILAFLQEPARLNPDGVPIILRWIATPVKPTHVEGQPLPGIHRATKTGQRTGDRGVIQGPCGESRCNRIDF